MRDQEIIKLMKGIFFKTLFRRREEDDSELGQPYY